MDAGDDHASPAAALPAEDDWVLRSKNQLRHKTGVTGPGELLNPIQHSPPTPQRPGTIPRSTRNCQPAISNLAPKPWGKPRDSNLRHL